MGFLNRDLLLDENKINGRLILELSNKKIENLDGLQYFKQVWWLDISYNKIEELKNLPPNLTRLECYRNEIKEFENLPSKLERFMCSYNKLETINNLPSHLKHLDCSNNLIKKITNLPDNLEFLNFSDNLVTNFPRLPSSLQSINYYNNPLDISTLPELYKNNIPCDHPNQNCIPYELVNWKLLSNNIKDTVFDILALNVTINVAHGWGMGKEIRKIYFVKKGKRLICKNENIHRTYGAFGASKEPTTENKKNKHSINIEDLELFLKDLYNRKMIFEIRINDRLEKINLRTKRNGDPLCRSCIDCSSYTYKYEIYTTKDTIILNYHYAGENRIEICGNYIIEIIDGNLVPYTKDRPEDIRAILNSLYINKLERLILNRKYDFNDFEEIIKWEKNYK
jgi:hypothetical protein